MGLGRGFCVVGSSGAAEAQIYDDAPLLKQPFRDVEPISASLAPCL
jgi:hypothetical protein